MRKSVSLLVTAALCVVMFGLPATANADELKVAKRWALGLSANALNYGLTPTVEYWTSENFGLSASLSWFYYGSLIGVRGTYLFDTPINIFPMPARPYVGAGLGFLNYNAFTGYSGYSSVGGEIFGGLFQPFSEWLSVRAELEASSFGFVNRAGYRSFSPLSVGFGIFYHFGH